MDGASAASALVEAKAPTIAATRSTNRAIRHTPGVAGRHVETAPYRRGTVRVRATHMPARSLATSVTSPYPRRSQAREAHMAENGDYRVLILTSDGATIDEVTEIGRRNFQDSTVVYWELGNAETKPGVIEQIEATDYNLIISHINGLILKPHHLAKRDVRRREHPSGAARASRGVRHLVPARDRARHPHPPRHDGARDGRGDRPRADLPGRPLGGAGGRHDPARRGAQLRRTAWPSPPRSPRSSRAARTDRGASRRSTSTGTRRTAITRSRTCGAWFAALDPDHPAHQERIPLNHPRAIISPPYFDDV